MEIRYTVFAFLIILSASNIGFSIREEKLTSL